MGLGSIKRLTQGRNARLISFKIIMLCVVFGLPKQQGTSTSKKPCKLTPDLYCCCKQSHSINGRAAALPLHALPVHTKLLHASGQVFSHFQLLQQIPWNSEYKLNPEIQLPKLS